MSEDNVKSITTLAEHMGWNDESMLELFYSFIKENTLEKDFLDHCMKAMNEQIDEYDNQCWN